MAISRDSWTPSAVLLNLRWWKDKEQVGRVPPNKELPSFKSVFSCNCVISVADDPKGVIKL